HDVAVLLKHILEVHPDQRLILGDHHAKRGLAPPLTVSNPVRYIGIRPYWLRQPGRAPVVQFGRDRGLKHRAVWVRVPPGAHITKTSDPDVSVVSCTISRRDSER